MTTRRSGKRTGRSEAGAAVWAVRAPRRRSRARLISAPALVPSSGKVGAGAGARGVVGDRGRVALGQHDGELVGAVLGDQIHVAQVVEQAVDVGEHGVAGALESQHHHAERALVAQGAIDLHREPVLELGHGGELAPARRARPRDDRGDRADADHVAGGRPPHAGDRHAVDRGAVAAAEVLDDDRLAAPPDRGVAARHRVVLDHHAGTGAAPEHELGAVIERDHARVVLLVERDDQVPGAARRLADDGVQSGGAVQAVRHEPRL
jgi:hypothetical protein